MELAPPPRHVGSNVFIWADGLTEGVNYFASMDNMRAGITCSESEALVRVRLLRVGSEPVVYKKVWWDEENTDDTVYAEDPGADPEAEYMVSPMDYTDMYPAKAMEHLEGDWFYVDWMWRDTNDPKVRYKLYPQDTYPVDLFERIVTEADPPYTEWNNVSQDKNIHFECMVKLAPHTQDAEVEDHPMCPHRRVKIEIDNQQNPDGTWLLYVVEHYFVEA